MTMRIIASTKLEDCFDGSVVYGYDFDEPWRRAAIEALGELGDLQFFADFPRPLFKLTSPAGTFIKGVGGSTSCRVVFPRENTALEKEKFEHFFTNFVSRAPPI